MKRLYISLYFKDIRNFGKVKPYLTVAFDSKSELYEVCKKLGSSGMKKLIQCDTYKCLKDKASKDNRSISNFIKTTILKKLKI